MTEHLLRHLTGRSARQPVRFQLQLLGDFALHDGRTHVALSEGPRRLLAFLAINGTAPRPVVMGTLWPEASEPHARGSLRTSIWRLRRAAPGVLRPAGDVLALHPDVLVDVQVVTESARAILHEAGLAPADPIVLRARGELLPGWYEDWVIWERERLRQFRLHALDTLAMRFAAQGRYADALEAAMESARIEPLRESANGMIISIHLAEANVAEALRHYEFFRNLLHAELDLEPSPQLTALLPDHGTPGTWFRTLRTRAGESHSTARRAPEPQGRPCPRVLCGP